MMRAFFLLVILLSLLCSCTVQKRLYRPGFSFLPKGKVVRADEIIPPQTARISSFLESKIDFTNPARATAVTTECGSEQSIVAIKTFETVIKPEKNLPYLKPLIAHRSNTFLTVTPNSVSKAGFRTFIYSLIFFGGALYCFFNLSGLVYITAGLLIMAFVFCLVSLLTSVSARNDKINNSKGWLTLSLITLLLDILEIAAIVIFFIALF